jgi:3-oxoacyl-[acyl-carrier-protein] synthase III
MKIKITGIGSYIPEKKVSNTDFGNHVFLNEDGSPFGRQMISLSISLKESQELSTGVMLNRSNFI